MSIYEFVEKLKLEKTSDTVFIIGGGSSLLKTLPDKDILEGKDIICCNTAYELYPNALLCHFMDERWYQWNKEDLLQKFKSNISTSSSTINHQKKLSYDKTGISIFCRINSDKTRGIATEDLKIIGNNSLHQTINITYHLGYKSMIVLGMDCNPAAKTLHWHNKHKVQTNVDTYKSMIKGFELISLQQEKLGFKVYNTNPESHVKCFEFRKLEEFLI